MRALLSTLLLVTASFLAGCLGAGEGEADDQDTDLAGGSPTVDPTAVPTSSPSDPPRPIDGYEPHTACRDDAAECFTFIWVKGEERPTVLEGPEGMPYRGQGALCNDRHPQRDGFAHEVRADDQMILHPTGRALAPQESLLVLDHFRPAAECAIAFALLPDPVGSVPMDMGRAGTYSFAWDAPDVVVNASHPVPPGHFLAVEYNVTETNGEWVVRHDGRFEVRNMGLWPQSALVPYEADSA